MEWHSLRCRFAHKGFDGLGALLRVLYSELDYDAYMKFLFELYNTGKINLKFLYGRVSYKTFKLAQSCIGNYYVRPVKLK